MNRSPGEKFEAGSFAKGFDIHIEKLFEPRYSPVTFVKASSVRKVLSLSASGSGKKVRRHICRGSAPSIDSSQLPLLTSTVDKETDVYVFPILSTDRASVMVFSLRDNSPCAPGASSNPAIEMVH